MKKNDKASQLKVNTHGFRDFIKDQGLVGVAVGLILGTASGTLIKSLIDNMIMPPLGFILGSADGLKGLSWSMGVTPSGQEAVLNYGTFLNDLVNFLVIALTVYMLIKVLSKIFGEDYSKKKQLMDKLKFRAISLLENVENSAANLDLPNKMGEISEIEKRLTNPEIWNNPTEAQKTTRKLADLKKTTQPWYTLKIQIKDILEMMELGDDLIDEFEEQISAFEAEYAELKKQLLFTGEYDNHGATIRITAGVGGTDAQDFAEMLERMYLRWADKNDYKTEVVERSAGEDAGVKTTVFDVEGLLAYGKLKSEHGVHRLVRISPFNSGGSRETSFAQVEILPNIDTPDEIKIDDKDLKIDVYRSGRHGGQSVNTTDSAVRITHIPTGVVVAIQNERSQTQNKETAMRILRGKLVQLQLDQHAENLSELQAGKSAEWGAQIRNYVLNPYKLVKDVRTKHEEKDVDKVLNGEINGFIEAYLESLVEKQKRL